MTRREPAMLRRLAWRRIRVRRPDPCEPPSPDELEALRHYLPTPLFEAIVTATASISPGLDWFDELDARLGKGTGGQAAAAFLEADRDGKIVLT